MNTVHRDIFQAIHEGRWLSIEYYNKHEQVTKYWIGIQNLNIANRTLSVEGLHLGKYVLKQFDQIRIDSILSSQVIDGSYHPVNQNLVSDIQLNPHKYKTLFDQVANLKILNYLEDCNRMDTIPYKQDFSLVRYLDRDSFRGDFYPLSEEQFRKIVQEFQIKAERKKETEHLGKKPVIQQLAMNVMSIHTPKGLYVLAYRKLCLDVKQRCLRPDEDITVCTEFTVDGTKENIRKYLDAEDYELLQDFEVNQEQIKDAVTRSAQGRRNLSVDDMPYIIGLGMNIPLDLHKEYGAVLELFQREDGKEAIPVPIKAFFGELLERPRSGRTAPITLLNKKVNLDQLLAVNNAMKYPVAYIQGPPGTGKTNTIINTITTAFFNQRTVLFSCYNNHPIDGVVEKLTSITYQGKPILFPIIRLGNSSKIKLALAEIKAKYEQAKRIIVYESTLDRSRGDRTERAKKLSVLLKKYEDILDLKERSETIGRMLEYNRQHAASMQMIPFEADLEGRQLKRVNRQIEKAGEITDADALALLTDDIEDLKKYLYYISAKYIQRIDEPENQDLRNILLMQDEEEQAQEFCKYLGNSDNLKKFLEIFPVIATTCISAHRLGEPQVLFDMTIMDEASQCNTAVALVPIIRGKRLMLVGDPQQLNPVILLDEASNQRLRRKYAVTDEYDYRKNSIYKTYLACDPVSDEVLLRYHYRCNRNIIEFNNRKYYNSRLLVRSDSREAEPLKYINVSDGRADYKNTSLAEAEEIIRFAVLNKDKSIGVITPFVNQKHLIEKRLGEERLKNVSCGTVHAFQGDEKDVVLFSTAITDSTYAGTYAWLKNNKELINVATSRAKDKLIVLSNTKNLERLHQEMADDDLYDLIRYVQTKGASSVTPKKAYSRALGVKPFSSETEEAFLETLSHALDNIWLTQNRFSVEKEVAVSQVFEDNVNYSDLFYSGRFDFVIYERNSIRKYPVLVIELDGKEHFENDVVKARDRKKQAICKAHEMQLIRVENSYARRYQHIKGILETYFAVGH